MDITISSSLTPREKDKIFLLLDACYKKEPVSLTFPTEEAIIIFLPGKTAVSCAQPRF